ncbi:hypothetical protein TruAng_011932 [Truncatella angustata]|nr:hypothetical protein TruAng_011932 [Truncatella angustata]
MASPTYNPTHSHTHMVPMSVHHLAIQEFAGILHHYQAYTEGVRHRNTDLRQVIDQLHKKINEMSDFEQNQGKVIEAQRERVRFLESAQAAPSPLELTLAEYVSTDNTQLPTSCNTTPSYAAAVDTPKEDYMYEESLLAFVESYRNTGEVVTKSLKRISEDESEGDAKRQARAESWQIMSDSQ